MSTTTKPSEFHPAIVARLADITQSKAGARVRALELKLGKGTAYEIVGEVLTNPGARNYIHERWEPTRWLSTGRHRLRTELDLAFNLPELQAHYQGH